MESVADALIEKVKARVAKLSVGPPENDCDITPVVSDHFPFQAMIFFRAHGVPVSYVEEDGDPYRDQMEECIFLIMQELEARGVRNDHTLAYQVQGIKPCVSVYGADQFYEADEQERKKNSSFFNWFYFSINIGALIASFVLVWILQMNVGCGWGFGVPAVGMVLAIIFVFDGSPF